MTATFFLIPDHVTPETTPLVRRMANEDRMDYRLAGWSFGMWDWNWWRKPRPDRLADRLAGRASDGDIVVMHDGHHEGPRADRQSTVEAAALMIPRLRARLRVRTAVRRY